MMKRFKVMYYNFPNSLQRVEANSEKEAAEAFFEANPAKDYITVMSGVLKETFYNWRDFESKLIPENLAYLEEEEDIFYSIRAFRDYAQFDGRAGRRDFWHFFVFNIVVLTLLVGAEQMFGARPFSSLLSMTSVYGLFALLPFVSVTVRRLHDTDKSGWFALLYLIPIVGTIILLILLSKKGMKNDNRFGRNSSEELESDRSEERQSNQ